MESDDDAGLDDPAFTEAIPSGFFGGETGRGEPMSILVGEREIARVQVSCGGPDFTAFEIVGAPIAEDGTFVVYTSSGPRPLTVSGGFRDLNRVRGTVEGDPFCDGRFELRRCDFSVDGDCVAATRSPTATPSPSVTATPTETVRATATPAAQPTVTPTPESGQA